MRGPGLSVLGICPGRVAIGVATLAILAILASGCGSGSGETETTNPPPANPSPPASGSSAKEKGAGREERNDNSAGGDPKPARGGEASIEDFGAEAAGSDREAILASFDGYLRALAARDFATACFHLEGTVRRSLERLVPKALKARGCPAILPRLLAPTAAAIAREQANGKVTKVRVEGDRSFVIFKAPGAELYQLTMVREGGEWKAATVAASVLVPDL